MEFQPVAKPSIAGQSALRLGIDLKMGTARTFVGRQAYLVRGARGEEIGHGDVEVRAEIGTRSRARLPAVSQWEKFREQNLGEERDGDGFEGGVRVRRGAEGGGVQEVEVAEGVGPGAEVREEGDERGGVGAQGVAVGLLEEAVEVRQLLGAAGEPLDVRHEGLQGLHQRRRRSRRRRARPRRRRGRRREVVVGLGWVGVSGFGSRLRCGDSLCWGLFGLGVFSRIFFLFNKEFF